jgi:hypothetical protein
MYQKSKIRKSYEFLNLKNVDGNFIKKIVNENNENVNVNNENNNENNNSCLNSCTSLNES